MGRLLFGPVYTGKAGPVVYFNITNLKQFSFNQLMKSIFPAINIGCGKVMFSRAFISHSVHREKGVWVSQVRVRVRVGNQPHVHGGEYQLQKYLNPPGIFTPMDIPTSSWTYSPWTYPPPNILTPVLISSGGQRRGRYASTGMLSCYSYFFILG